MSQLEDPREHLIGILETFDTAMLVTRGADGAWHGRPMGIAAVEPTGDLYFSTSLDSPKVAEIEAEPQAIVTLQGGGRFATVTGFARIERDRALIDRLWSEAWRVWFPAGKTDPSLCLIAFRAAQGEYWDNAGAKGLRYAFAAVKAVVQGKRPEADLEQNAKVSL